MSPFRRLPFLLGTAALIAAGAPACAWADTPARARAEAQAQLARIARYEGAVNAIIVHDANAARDAAAAAAAHPGSPIAGRTVLIKDNIETREWPTTAGSLALAGNATGRDAPLVARLRGAGAVIMGKTNLSEWANIRSGSSTSGWSAVGGLTRNPHALDRNACGSSSGSGAAVAAGFAWAAVGTETDGSVTCPASLNGVVGFKPTVGLVSRTYVVPISHSQDTPGPMTRTVADAALLLTAMAGPDPADPATALANGRVPRDFAAGLAAASLKGQRIGVLRRQAGSNDKLTAVFDAALADMKRAGAELVEIDYTPDPAMGRDEYGVLLFELREDLGAYLRGLPGKPKVRSLADVIAFDAATPAEMRWFGQDTFEEAEHATDRAAYEKARANSLRLAGKDGIDKLLADNRVTMLVAPTEGPAWPLDLVTGAGGLRGVGAGNLAAIAGYPHLTVPMGAVEGLPIGLSFIAGAWDDAKVLQAGAAYERARTARISAPSFRRWGE
ncbi:amidase [Parablastomonas sp. CN1-191]|uniref:amidase n=1 Tax=Parablastomonas sp. CN1-191 TaxID=3400908 RepID=UPI003BF8D873